MKGINTLQEMKAHCSIQVTVAEKIYFIYIVSFGAYPTN
jgi:hypothetical protein